MTVFKCPPGEDVEDFNIRTGLPQFPSSSDEEEQFESYPEEQDSFLDSLASHLEYCKAFINRSISRWTLSLPDLNGNRLIRQPIVSKLSHDALHPALLRYVQDGVSMLKLSERFRAPENWQERISQAIASEPVQRQLHGIRTLPPGTAEMVIQTRFQSLFQHLASALGIEVYFEGQRKIGVGGILALNYLDVKGETDLCILDERGICLTVFEFKTSEAFEADNWYRACRGTQLLTAMFHYNAPTFLVSPMSWKLFYENEARDALFTFPTMRSSGFDFSGPFENSLQLGTVGTEMLTTVGLTLLAGTTERADLVTQCTPKKQILEKIERSVEKKREIDKTEPPTKFANTSKLVPKFLTGKQNGIAMYQNVRLYSDEELDTMDMDKLSPKAHLYSFAESFGNQLNGL